jgi:hypothetical protein
VRGIYDVSYETLLADLKHERLAFRYLPEDDDFHGLLRIAVGGGGERGRGGEDEEWAYFYEDTTCGVFYLLGREIHEVEEELERLSQCWERRKGLRKVTWDDVALWGRRAFGDVLDL